MPIIESRVSFKGNKFFRIENKYIYKYKYQYKNTHNTTDTIF